MGFTMEYRYVPFTALLIISDREVNRRFLNNLSEMIKRITECSIVALTTYHSDEIEFYIQKFIEQNVEQVVFQPIFNRKDIVKYMNLNSHINKIMCDYLNLEWVVNDEVYLYQNIPEKIIYNLEEALQ